MPDKKSETKIISGLFLEKESVKLRTEMSKIIPAAKSGEISRVQIIGGDSQDPSQDSPPAIVIEKENDKISKIITNIYCKYYFL